MTSAESETTSALADLPEAVEKLLSKVPPSTPEQLAEWEWNNEILPHLKASQIPDRFHRREIEWNAKQRNVFMQCEKLCTGTGAIVALVGERGLGKTTIAAQMILRRAQSALPCPWHRRPPYRKAAHLVAKYKSLYSDYGSIETERLTESRNSLAKDHPLLIIDELHECDDQKMKDRVLTDLIDLRYGHLADTILISNQTPEEFTQTTSDSILSRLSEHGRIIKCSWPSFREKAA